jgi:hypothetical protein
MPNKKDGISHHLMDSAVGKGAADLKLNAKQDQKIAASLRGAAPTGIGVLSPS